jgi:hypothetical protein
MSNRACETVPDLKPLLGLTPKHHYAAMLFGYPAIHFARTVQRDSTAVIQRLGIRE